MVDINTFFIQSIRAVTGRDRVTNDSFQVPGRLVREQGKLYSTCKEKRDSTQMN